MTSTHSNRSFLLAALVLAAFVFATASPAQKGESNTRTVTGQVVNKAGDPIVKAVVYLKDVKTLQVRTTFTSDSGAFHFSGLNPNIDYQVHAESDGVSSPVKTISSFDSRKQVNISLKIQK
jgi:hypothetical protein